MTSSKPNTAKSRTTSSASLEIQKSIEQNQLEILSAIQNKNPYYLNREGSESIALTNQPFSSPSECQNSQCKVVGTVDNQTELIPTGDVKVRKSSGSQNLEVWYEVEYATGPSHIHKAWIKKENISHKKKSLLETLKTDLHQDLNGTLSKKGFLQQSYEACMSALRKPVFVPGLYDIKGLADRFLKMKTPTKSLSTFEVTQKLSGLAGVCSYRNLAAPQLEDFAGNNTNSQSRLLSYDNSVLPALIQKSSGLKDNPATVLSQVTELNIPGLTPQKFFEIDALARTIFAEMQSCYPKGQEYFSAVARVIKNREEALLTGKKRSLEFIFEAGDSLHWPGKSVSTRVATSPIQFSSWNTYILDPNKLTEKKETETQKLLAQGLPQEEAKGAVSRMIRQEAKDLLKENPTVTSLKFYIPNISGLKHTLCPPSRRQEKFYENRIPNDKEFETWQAALQTAVEATMSPRTFNRKTQSLSGILYYTSNRSSFYDMTPVNASLNGKPLHSSKCINFWKEKKPTSKSP